VAAGAVGEQPGSLVRTQIAAIWPALIFWGGTAHVESASRVPAAAGDREEDAGSHLEGAYRSMQRGDASAAPEGAVAAGG